MNATGGTRRYSNQLRAEQAEQTRARVVQAAVDLLTEGDAGDFSMADVAARAGVSLRTVYRNFATRDDLLDGVVGWISGQLESRVGPQPANRDDYVRVTPHIIGVLFDIEPLYRALFATHAGRASHLRSNAGRRQELGQAFATEMRGLDDDATRRLGALLHLVSSSNAALFLKDYWGLSADDVGQTLQWAIEALSDAARDPKRKGNL